MPPLSPSSFPVPPPIEPTPNISSFLSRIGTGFYHSSPSLPLHAQSSLISIQLSTIEEQTALLVRDTKDHIVALVQRSQTAEASLDALVGRIDKAEHAVQATDGIEGRPFHRHLRPTLQQFSNHLYTSQYAEHLFAALQVLQRALTALERAEDELARGYLSVTAHTATRAQIDQAYGPFLAALPIASTVGLGPLNFNWLVGTNMPRAVADLLERRTEISKRAAVMIQQGWLRCVNVQHDEESDQWRLLVLQDVAFSSNSDELLSLADLVEMLEENGQLEAKLETLAVSLTNMLSASCLSQRDAKQWTAVVDPASNEQLLLKPTFSGEITLDCLCHLVLHLKTHLLSRLSQSAARQFSRKLLSLLIPLLLEKLQLMLPPYSSGQDAAHVRAVLYQLRTSAEAIHAALKDSIMVPMGLKDDSEEHELLGSPSSILRFASTVHTQYSNKCAATIRIAARQLCSSDSEAAWDTEQIGVEETLLSSAVEEAAVNDLPGSAPSVLLVEECLDDGQNEWGCGNVEDQQLPTPALWKKPAETGGLARSASQMSASMSTDGDSSHSRSISPVNLQHRQREPMKKGKNALGGVRLMKPSDQMGTEPLQGGEEDDYAWGLDGDVADDNSQTATNRHLPNAVEVRNSAEHRTVEFDSISADIKDIAALAGSSRRPLDLTVSVEEADDAWFAGETDFQNKEFSNAPSSDPEAKPSPHFAAPSLFAINDDADDDAWGLSEEEKVGRAAARKSMVTIPVESKLLDEEAGGQVEESSAVPELISERAQRAHPQHEAKLAWMAENKAETAVRSPLLKSSSDGSEKARGCSLDGKDELDNDAPSLSEEQQEASAVKRASRGQNLGQPGLSQHRPVSMGSALPRGIGSHNSDFGSDDGMPATPQSERSDTADAGGTMKYGAMSSAGGSLDEDGSSERNAVFPIQSALPASGASSFATGSAGPDSDASLPPTPKAESELSLPGYSLPTTNIALLSPARNPSSRSTAGFRPETPLEAEDAAHFPPFPVHSAIPYHGTLRGSVLGTGPSSVASGLDGRSDIALPPSPPPQLQNNLSSGGWEAAQLATGRTTVLAEAAPDLGELAVVGESDIDQSEKESLDSMEDDDPWADVDAQWEAEQHSQRILLKSAQAGDSSLVGVSLGAEAPLQEKQELRDDQDWAWVDEGPNQSSPRAARTTIQQDSSAISRSLAHRAMRTRQGRSSSASGASPHMRQATLRNAEAAVTTVPARLPLSATSGERERLTADALARNDNGLAQQQVDLSHAQRPEPKFCHAPRSRQKTEMCRISKRSRDLVELAQGVLDDTLALIKGDISVDAMQLLRALAEIFEIYRSLMPSLHGQTLAEIPSLAMQFANDCRFLAKEILVLNDTVRESTILTDIIGEPPIDSLMKEAALITALGKDVFELQMATQASALDELLSQTDSFLRVYQDERFVVCSKVISQLLHHLTSLHRGWGEVLTPSSCAAALGTLIQAILSRIGSNVLEIDDVGEREGERLAELIRLLVPLQRLFPIDPAVDAQGVEADEQDGSTSAVASFVPSWVKITGYLPEILLGSLADVEFLLFEAGGLINVTHGGGSVASSTGFSKEEAKRLIRSTFADTPRRAALLSRVGGTVGVPTELVN